ncbi:MAG: DNA-protecting protein DprA [Proteobacteria bacterium]|nr:DNA-protecting protein DprA [Pseudomonadota bacterium]
MKPSPSSHGLLALWLMPGLGPRRIGSLLEHFENVENIFQASPKNLADVLGVNSKFTGSIPKALDSDAFHEEVRLVEKYGLEVLDLTHEEYPHLLRETYHAPPVLFKKGSFNLNLGVPLAFVGSRKSSFAGKNICQKLIRRLAEIRSDTVIVSGLAIGIDSAAHKAALDCGLKTVSVLAGGLSSIYPAQNRKLSEKIAENGALITEFPVKTKPVAVNFPLRNRIISGISKGVVVVEAGERSGASITAGYALEQNRELFALPGPADSRFYRGTNRLIQKGQAKLVMEAEDILEEILTEPFDYKKGDVSNKIKETTTDLTMEEKGILKLLEEGSAHQDALANGLNVPVHKLIATLTMLELKGLIVGKSGSVYQAVER